ncbi:hypothetical protein [Streptomyces sp. NPDC093970]
MGARRPSALWDGDPAKAIGLTGPTRRKHLVDWGGWLRDPAREVSEQ